MLRLRGQNTHTMPQCKIRCGLWATAIVFTPFVFLVNPLTHAHTHKHMPPALHMSTHTNTTLVCVCAHTHTSIHVFLASCLKYAVFCLCASVNRSKGKGGNRQRRREKWDKREAERELSHRTTLLRAAVALPDFPLIAFSWYLNPGPFGFWRPAQTPQSPQRPIQLPDPSLTPCRG